MRRGNAFACGAALLMSGCVTDEAVLVYTPPPPPNVVMAGPIEAAAGHELVMGDNLFPAAAEIPAHSHPGEEFLLVQAGEVVLRVEGEAERRLRPGDSLRIPPGVVHSATVGNAGARVVSNWIKPLNAPLRVPATTEEEGR